MYINSGIQTICFQIIICLLIVVLRSEDTCFWQVVWSDLPGLLHTWQRPPAELINSPSQWSIAVWFLTFLVVTLLWLILYYLALNTAKKKKCEKGHNSCFLHLATIMYLFSLKTAKIQTFISSAFRPMISLISTVHLATSLSPCKYCWFFPNWNCTFHA